MSRIYLKRAFGFMFDGKFTQGNPYHAAQQGALDVEGVFGDAAFDSIGQLVAMAKWDETRAKEFVAKVQEMMK
jgi:hypothetical protein